MSNITRFLVLFAGAVLLVGCGENGGDCRSQGADWTERQRQSIAAYAATEVSDKQRLEAARDKAVQAALAIVRSCLQACGGCDIVSISPELAAVIRESVSKFVVSRVEIGAERDGRKSIVAIMDIAELSAPVAIGIDVRPGEPVRLYVSELVAE